VLARELEIRGAGGGFDAITVTQYDGGSRTLTGGTWIVRDPDGSGSGRARFDMRPADAGITTIGAGAAVELTGPNSEFPQLTSSLTTVAGTLTVNDRVLTAPGGTLTVSGTVAGTGTFSGDVVAEAGGTVAPGADAGAGVAILSFEDNVELQSLSIFSVDLDGTTPGTGHDQMLFTDNGTLTLDNALLAIDLGFTPAIADEFVIVDGFGALAGAGQFAGLPDGTTFSVEGSDLAFRIFYNDDHIVLAVSPEPATLALLGAGIACLRLRRRRRKSL